MITKIMAFTSYLKTCTICHGLGYLENAGGDTRECWACKGKGYL